VIQTTAAAAEAGATKTKIGSNERKERKRYYEQRVHDPSGL